MVTPREAGPGSPVSCVVAFEGNNCDLSEADQTLFKSFLCGEINNLHEGSRQN